MPSIKDDSTVEAIAREFCSNGRIGRKALKAVGYSDKYAEHRTDKVLSNVAVKAAIARIDAKSRLKSVKSRKERQEFWTDAMENAPNMCDRLRASELLGKSEADFITVTRDITEEPVELTLEQAALYKEAARIAIADSLSGPKLAKEA